MSLSVFFADRLKDDRGLHRVRWHTLKLVMSLKEICWFKFVFLCRLTTFFTPTLISFKLVAIWMCFCYTHGCSYVANYAWNLTPPFRLWLVDCLFYYLNSWTEWKCGLWLRCLTVALDQNEIYPLKHIFKRGTEFRQCNTYKSIN